MPFDFTPLSPLAEGAVGQTIFRDWVGDGILLPGSATELTATKELSRSLDLGKVGNGGDNTPSPLFCSRWKSQWEKDLPRFLKDESEGARFGELGKMLGNGGCDVVVTGQQPGFLGGPLYTLFKVATTISLARRRTAAGRPTVPVFWSADDDDDLTEALDSLFWKPGEREFRRAETVDSGPGSSRRSIPVGELPASAHGSETARWFTDLVDPAGREVGGDSLAADLADIWEQAMDQNWSWSRLQGRALSRVFSGCDLVIVSGNDSTLHEAAAPIYRHILDRQEELSALARTQGQILVKGGWHAQIAPRSLAKPLFRIKDGRREHLPLGLHGVEVGTIRPGVLFRSLIQDWLLRPSAVVVGPGELAYLRQLDPLYDALGVPRGPLVPRLFGWLGPKGIDPKLIRRHGTGGGPSEDRLAVLADLVAGDAEKSLRETLCESLGLDRDRAGELAQGRARRFRKGVLSLLSTEAGRKAAADSPSEPFWVFPEGQRQERRLASFCAAAIWGDELVTTLLAAADDHLDRGLSGAWSEYLIEV